MSFCWLVLATVVGHCCSLAVWHQSYCYGHGMALSEPRAATEGLHRASLILAGICIRQLFGKIVNHSVSYVRRSTRIALMRVEVDCQIIHPFLHFDMLACNS